MKARRLVLAALVSWCCSSNHPTSEDLSCFLPLDSYCGQFPCPSYEQALVALQQVATGFCFVAQVGRCNEMRFTHRGAGFGDTTLYFDASGAVVAVHETSDAVVVGSACPGWKHYGRRVSCELAVLEDYCGR